MVDGNLFNMEVSGEKKTVPPRYPFIHGIFHGINHPAIGN
jgi:hypothetical protein